MLRRTAEFLNEWSPHIWLFGAVFGMAMSGTLFRRACMTRRTVEGSRGVNRVTDFWFRHGLWLLILHMSYVAIGAMAVMEIKSEWVGLTTLLVLLATPLILVYRSYDSLRLTRTQRRSSE